MNNFPNNLNSANTFPNNQYGPFGYNDQNFNRQRFPSNIYPANGGLPGSNFGVFNPLSTNTMRNMRNIPSMSNYEDSYRPNEPMIEKPDYRNKNELLHNNVGDNIYDEHVVEYRINIDSLDRDISVYPDPFKFTVKFDPPGPERVQQEVYFDTKDKSKGSFIQETRFQGAPTPHIIKEFENVKYIKLENVVLPKYNQIKEEDGEYVFDTSSSLLDDRFVSLIIDELDWQRTFATYDSVTRIDPDTGKLYTPKRQFAIILPDKVGPCYYSGIPFYGSRVYKNSQLGNIKQLTIDFRDSCGIPIRFNNLKTADELEEENCKNTPAASSDIRHPLNKKLQLHLSFIVGVVEGQINTNTKLEN